VSTRVRGRLWRGIGFGVAGLAVCLGLLVWLALPAIVWRRVQQEAELRGVRLTSCSLELSWHALELAGCAFALTRFPEVAGSLGKVAVAIEGLKPVSMRVSRPQVKVSGLPRLQDMAQQMDTRAGGSFAFELEHGELAWSAEGGGTPWLALSELSYRSHSGAFLADAALFGTRFRGALSGDAQAAQLRVAAVDNVAVDLAFSLSRSAGAVELVIESHKLPLAELEGSWLQLSRELEHVSMDGRLHVVIPVGLTAEVPSGDVRAVLTGLNFPVPRELEGLVYGTPAQFMSHLTFARNLERAELERVTFSVGALGMRGRGRVQLDNAGLGFQLSLNGDLPCTTIASSAAAAHQESALAKAVGRLAKKAVAGSVQIGSVLEGNSRDLEHASVATSVGVGCGLRPLPLDGLIKAPIGLLQQLAKLPGMPSLTGEGKKANAPPP
jgi:hypothetical protein